MNIFLFYFDKYTKDLLQKNSSLLNYYETTEGYAISLPSIQDYRIAANATNTVTTQGASIGLNYYINSNRYKNYIIKFMNDCQNLFNVSMRYHIKAIETYKKIDSLVGERKKDGKYKGTSYKETREKVINLAAGLIDIGYKKGDRAALIADGRNDWIISELGILYAGGINVPLSIRLETTGHSHNYPFPTQAKQT